MPNSYSKQAYVQGFNYENISFKKAVNVFEHTEIAESIYEYVVEPYYKTLPGQIPIGKNKRGESASYKTHPTMGESAGKRWKGCVDCSKSELKTFLIHGTIHSSDECIVLWDFGSKYAKVKPTKEHGNHPIPGKKKQAAVK